MTSAELYALGLSLLQWIGVAFVLVLFGTRLVEKATYDAWHPDNVDVRLVWGGFFLGLGVSWFFFLHPFLPPEGPR